MSCRVCDRSMHPSLPPSIHPHAPTHTTSCTPLGHSPSQRQVCSPATRTSLSRPLSVDPSVSVYVCLAWLACVVISNALACMPPRSLPPHCCPSACVSVEFALPILPVSLSRWPCVCVCECVCVCVCVSDDAVWGLAACGYVMVCCVLVVLCCVCSKWVCWRGSTGKVKPVGCMPSPGPIK